MAKKELIIVADYSQQEPLTLEDLCRICNISADFIQDLVDYDIIHGANEIEERLFDMQELQRIQTAIRLQRDLEVNLPGVALALELLEELEELRAQMDLIRKHYDLK